MTNKKIFTVTLAVTIIHFTLTSVIGYYIAVQIGTQMGKIVADGLIEASGKKTDKAEEEANRIYQNMKSKSDSINESWKIPYLLISLPAKPLITPFLREIKKGQLNRFISKEISKEQFRTRWKMLDYAASCANSLSLGFIVYLILRIWKHYKIQT